MSVFPARSKGDKLVGNPTHANLSHRLESVVRVSYLVVGGAATMTPRPSTPRPSTLDPRPFDPSTLRPFDPSRFNPSSSWLLGEGVGFQHLLHSCTYVVRN
jgi:hypothetical protein